MAIIRFYGESSDVVMYDIMLDILSPETNWTEISVVQYEIYENPLQIQLTRDNIGYGRIQMYEDNSEFGDMRWYIRDQSWVYISSCGWYQYSTTYCPGNTLQIWTLYFNKTNFMLHCNDLLVFTLNYTGTCEEVWSEADRVNGLVFNQGLNGAKYRSMLTGEIL